MFAKSSFNAGDKKIAPKSETAIEMIEFFKDSIQSGYSEADLF